MNICDNHLRPPSSLPTSSNIQYNRNFTLPFFVQFSSIFEKIFFLSQFYFFISFFFLFFYFFYFFFPTPVIICFFFCTLFTILSSFFFLLSHLSFSFLFHRRLRLQRPSRLSIEGLQTACLLQIQLEQR